MHPSGALHVKEVVHVREASTQVMEDLTGHDQSEGVLDRHDIEGRRVALGQGDGAEAAARLAAVDEG